MADNKNPLFPDVEQGIFYSLSEAAWRHTASAMAETEGVEAVRKGLSESFSSRWAVTGPMHTGTVPWGRTGK